MLITPNSKYSLIANRNKNIFESQLLNGFESNFQKYEPYTQLCQYYISQFFDIYVYNLKVNKQVELFLKSISCKWLLFFLETGKIDQTQLFDKLLELPEKSALFSNILKGKSIKFKLSKGQYSFICCNLKETSESILLSYFSPLFEKWVEYPIIFNSLDFKTQLEWGKLLIPCEFSDLLASHLISQVQVILSRFCLEYKSRIKESITQSPTERKIFLVKNIIDCYPFKQHTLKSLSNHANLNIQFIKLKFQEIFQKTTHQYIIEKRMEYSKLLIETHIDYSVKEVSIICGFKKPQHFIRQFKKFHQLTPGQFKKNLIRK